MLDHSQGVSASSKNPPLDSPLDLLDALYPTNSAMLALAELLQTADLDALDQKNFAPGSAGYSLATNLRDGLSNIIRICLDNQNSILERYLDNHRKNKEAPSRKAHSPTIKTAPTRRNTSDPGQETLSAVAPGQQGQEVTA